jgi:glycerophosphoryl diester phosphodiesterase
MSALDSAFLGAPVAHRGLHNRTWAENSFEAFEAAQAAGYGIELDVQLTSDGRAVVFHDYDLDRLTGEPGLVRDGTLAEITALPLTGGGRIPSLADVVRTFAGRTPLLIEIKDQSDGLSPTDGALEAAVADDLKAATGPLAVMSFNPHSVFEMRDRAGSVARGLVTTDFTRDPWGDASAARRAALSEIPDFAAAGASFVSHHHADLDMPAIARLRAADVPVLCWTIRSPDAEAAARRVVQNITFEGYAAPFPSA